MSTDRPIERILPAFKGVKRRGKGWMALCPAHDDSTASLSVDEAKDGSVLVKCHAGCSFPKIAEAAGLEGAAFFPREPRAAAKDDAIAAVYPYLNAQSEEVYQVVRREPKKFSQRRPDGRGGWIWNLDGIERALYRLPELLASNPDQWVYVVEGEKDVDRLRECGLVATCNSGGAGKWQVAYAKYLHGHQVAIIPDNDAPGQLHAQAVAASLDGIAEYRLVDLSGVREHGDVSDWLVDHTVEELIALVEETPIGDGVGNVPSGLASNGASPTTAACTDLGNAERLLARYAQDLRWGEARGWLFYDGRRWAPGEELAQRAAATIARAIYSEAASCSDPDKRARLAAWATRSEAAGRLDAMLAVARWHEPFFVRAEQLDADPWLLNVRNGTIELKTGRLRKHRPADLITKLAPVDFDPAATSELWDSFLEQAGAGQDGLVDFLRRAVGYSCTGDTSEDVIFVPHGPAGTGKTTFTAAVQRTMGDYAGSVRIEALVERSTGGHNEDVAVLAGLRFVLTIEASESDRLREGLVKALTGGDQIPASRKYKASFLFTPTFKFWMATNEVPRVRSDDSGMWRRLRKLPFLNAHVNPDKSVRGRLLSEGRHRQAILAWAVRGCLEWQQTGLQPPTCVLVATDALRRSMDGLALFFEDCCDFSNENAWTSIKAIREAYATWAADQGIPERFRVSGNRLAEGLRQRGADDAERGHGKERGWWAVSVFNAGSAGSAGSTFKNFSEPYTREKVSQTAPALPALPANHSQADVCPSCGRLDYEPLTNGHRRCLGPGCGEVW